MSRTVRLLSISLVAFLVFPFLCLQPSAAPALSVSAESAILIDAARGEVLYEKNASARMPMASTTKIMTALVALEQAPPDLEIEIPPEAVGVEGSSIYLVEGEQLTLGELLCAVLLESANDAATAVAVAVGGSVEGFADLMNQKAKELGLRDTCFQNPHGLDDENHYTTAAELATIAKHALENTWILQTVATRKMTIPHSGTDGVRLLVNHNKMLRFYEGAIGVKTGFTKRSGRCLVSAAERGGVRLIAVTLNAPNDWNDHSAMLDHGFSVRTSALLCEAHGICLPVDVVGGVQGAVTVSNPEPLSTSLPIEHGEIYKTVELPRFLYAEVASGEIVGYAIYRCDLDGDGDAEEIGRVPLKVQSGVEKMKKKKGFWQWLRSLFGF